LPLEDCEFIPQVRERVFKFFNDSSLVHAYSEPDRGWQVLPREMHEFNDCPVFPAPVLSEICEAIEALGETEINFKKINDVYICRGRVFLPKIGYGTTRERAAFDLWWKDAFDQSKPKKKE
jgi:hypothetical protein